MIKVNVNYQQEQNLQTCIMSVQRGLHRGGKQTTIDRFIWYQGHFETWDRAWDENSFQRQNRQTGDFPVCLIFSILFGGSFKAYNFSNRSI